MLGEFRENELRLQRLETQISEAELRLNSVINQITGKEMPACNTP